MPRRTKLSLLGVALLIVAMALTWFVAHDVAFARRIDANVLGGFHQLGRPRLNALTNAIANLCDPMPFIVWAAVPVAIALVRGRPRVALALAVLLLGANESTEVLKPLLAGSRDPVPGVFLTDRTWPSGHATACMSLALAMVIAVPARWRPVTGAAMAAFCVAVVYSFLELGWHYPSDVLGGFEMSSLWALLVVAGLSWYEARRPVVTGGSSPAPAFTVGAALAPAILLLVCGVVFAGLLAAVRPHSVYDYATAHTAFVVGAALIAALCFICATGLNLMLRGGAATSVSGSGPAPTAAHRRRWPHG